MGIAMRIAINAVALLVVSYALDGVHVTGFGAALIAALVLGVINVTLRPILLVLTIPVNVMTLGLFTFVVNAAMLSVVAKVVTGFEIRSFGYALLGALLLSVVSSVLNGLAGTRGRRR